MSTNRQSEFLKMAFDARPVLTAYAFSLLKDWGLAQDIFQDAVISMNEKYEDIQKESPLSWLKMVILKQSRRLHTQTRKNFQKSRAVITIGRQKIRCPSRKGKNRVFKRERKSSSRLHGQTRIGLTKHTC